MKEWQTETMILPAFTEKKNAQMGGSGIRVRAHYRRVLTGQKGCGKETERSSFGEQN